MLIEQRPSSSKEAHQPPTPWTIRWPWSDDGTARGNMFTEMLDKKQKRQPLTVTLFIRRPHTVKWILGCKTAIVPF